jgi:hypothetical protein
MFFAVGLGGGANPTMKKVAVVTAGEWILRVE